MNSKAHQGGRFPFSLGMPRDYFARRKMIRKISTAAVIALFSLLVAGLLVYTADPNLSFLR